MGQVIVFLGLPVPKETETTKTTIACAKMDFDLLTRVPYFLASRLPGSPTPFFSVHHCRTGRGPHHSIHASHYEPARVEEMLRFEVFQRPPGSLLELNPQEIADVSKNAVLYFARQFPLGMRDPNLRLQREGHIQLQAGARERDVFQIGHSLFRPAGLVLPAEFHHVST